MIALRAHQNPTAAPIASGMDFSLEMETCHEELWLAIRAMPHAKKGFTAAELADRALAKLPKTQKYLQLLVRKQMVVLVGRTTANAELYALIRPQIDPVVFDRKGELSQDWERRRAIWRQIRSFQHFTIDKLWAVVSETGLVTQAQVKTYVKRLADAGFLVPLEKHGRELPGYMLRRSCNNGPLPPRLCEASLVFDVNTGCFHGVGIAHEVAL